MKDLGCLVNHRSDWTGRQVKFSNSKRFSVEERGLGATRPGGISLFRQGLLLYERLPRMREDRLRALMRRFRELLRQPVLFNGILGLL